MFEPRSGHVGFMVDKVAVGQVFSKYFHFPCQFSFHRLLHPHHLPSRASTIGQIVADVPSGLSLTPPQETTTKKLITPCSLLGGYQQTFWGNLEGRSESSSEMDTLYKTNEWTRLMNLTQRCGRGYRALSRPVGVESSSTQMGN
jgi:hypothetical protein